MKQIPWYATCRFLLFFLPTANCQPLPFSFSLWFALLPKRYHLSFVVSRISPSDLLAICFVIKHRVKIGMKRFYSAFFFFIAFNCFCLRICSSLQSNSIIQFKGTTLFYDTELECFPSEIFLRWLRSRKCFKLSQSFLEENTKSRVEHQSNVDIPLSKLFLRAGQRISQARAVEQPATPAAIPFNLDDGLRKFLIARRMGL